VSFVIHATRDVSASPDAVFDTIMSPERRPTWCYGVTEVRRLEDGPLAEGGRWLETGRNRKAGLDETNEFTCTIAIRPRHIRFIMTGPPKGPVGGSFHRDYRLEPHGAGTRIIAEFSSNTSGLLGLLIGLGKKAFALQFAGELDDLTRFLEGSHSAG
jgi:uncharacterized protein YndB with AHSA1/START domain